MCPPTSGWHTNSHQSVSKARSRCLSMTRILATHKGVWLGPLPQRVPANWGAMLSRFSRRYVRRQKLRDCRADGPSHGLVDEVEPRVRVAPFKVRTSGPADPTRGCDTVAPAGKAVMMARMSELRHPLEVCDVGPPALVRTFWSSLQLSSGALLCLTADTRVPVRGGYVVRLFSVGTREWSKNGLTATC